VARDHWYERVRQFAIDHMEIRAAHSASEYQDQQVFRLWRGHRKLDGLEVTRSRSR
jgi:hypothetical protein